MSKTSLFPYATALGLCLAGLAIRSVYETLKDRGRIDTGNGIVIGVVSAGMGMLLLSWPFLAYLDPVRLLLPFAVGIVAPAIMIAGIVLAVIGVIQLRGVENIERLVTKGLYSRLRHPMYTGFILWIAGWVIFRGAVASVIPAAACIAGILRWRKLEERKLEIQFGDEYRAYRLGTWF